MISWYPSKKMKNSYLPLKGKSWDMVFHKESSRLENNITQKNSDIEAYN